MKLLLIDQPLRNRGDESAHKALLRSLCEAFPDCSIVVPYRYPESAISPFRRDSPQISYVYTDCDRLYWKGRWYGTRLGLHFLWRLDPSIRRLIRLYEAADWIVAAPGGVNLGGFMDWHHLFFLELAKYLDKPLAYPGRSIGPFSYSNKEESLFSKHALRALEYCDFISLRDEKSVQTALALGLNFVRSCDSAFLEQPSGLVPEDLKMQLGGQPYFIFVPNSLVWHFNFRGVKKSEALDFFTLILDRLLVKYPAAKALMLPQLYDGPTEYENDIIFFREVAARSGDGRVVVAPDSLSSDIQQQLIREAQFLVGARYHSVVFAINNEVPFAALSYENKISGLAASLGLSDRVVDITGGLDALSVAEKVENILDTFKSAPDASVARKLAAEGFERFVEYLRKPAE